MTRFLLDVNCGGSFIIFSSKLNSKSKVIINTSTEEQNIILHLKKWSCLYLSNLKEIYSTIKDLLNINNFGNTIAQIKGKSMVNGFLTLSIEDDTFKGLLTVKNKSMSMNWYESFKEDDIVKIKTINRTYDLL